jgi:hypothetical protein
MTMMMSVWLRVGSDHAMLQGRLLAKQCWSAVLWMIWTS